MLVVSRSFDEMVLQIESKKTSSYTLWFLQQWQVTFGGPIIKPIQGLGSWIFSMSLQWVISQFYLEKLLNTLLYRCDEMVLENPALGPT